MPKSLYRRARGDEDDDNRDPVTVSRRRASQSSMQVKDYVLCRDCEQRFSALGENYALRELAKDGAFPLHESLIAQTPVALLGSLKQFSTSLAEGFCLIGKSSPISP